MVLGVQPFICPINPAVAWFCKSGQLDARNGVRFSCLGIESLVGPPLQSYCFSSHLLFPVFYRSSWFKTSAGLLCFYYYCVFSITDFSLMFLCYMVHCLVCSVTFLSVSGWALQASSVISDPLDLSRTLGGLAKPPRCPAKCPETPDQHSPTQH